VAAVLSQEVRLGGAFEFNTMFNWFTARQSVVLDEQYRIRATPELEGVLAEKIFYTTFVVEGLAAIHRLRQISCASWRRIQENLKCPFCPANGRRTKLIRKAC
jgi:hypothetical protein